ncbi:protein FAM185A-like [Saccostrea echinata]|uniref:protein FAM185A-like n=1 Tax=Saccostrea echinata TaxID=191078 RepID=UPI002A7EC530|nr:protein FAM185A-like [Saccostrea echinata]
MSKIYLKVPQISKSLLTRTFKQCLRKRFQACCSTSPTNETPENTQSFTISNANPGFLEGKFMATDKFGKLYIDVPFDIHIESLNPDKYPEMNKMFVKLFYDLQPDEKVDSSVLVALRQCYTFNVNFKDKKEFTAKGHFNSKVEYPVKCVVQLPMKFDLDVTARGCRTHIEKMESEKITVKSKSERAASTQSICTLKNIKCGTVEVEGTDCDVTSEKLLQGNSKITIKGQGNISAERLQGLTIQCQTDNGSISATSVYGENNSFHSNTGNISLNNCHGKTEVKVNSGDLKIDGLEGDFNGAVNEGNTDLYITKPENIAITTNTGNITLKVQGEVNASFDLSGSKVTYDSSLLFNDVKFSEDDPRSFKGNLGEGGGNISATSSSGSIDVEAFDWLKSLNLKRGE